MEVLGLLGAAGFFLAMAWLCSHGDGRIPRGVDVFDVPPATPTMEAAAKELMAPMARPPREHG
jgi:hypothetical protein